MNLWRVWCGVNVFNDDVWLIGDILCFFCDYGYYRCFVIVWLIVNYECIMFIILKYIMLL